jgi:hypothetical protein
VSYVVIRPKKVGNPKNVNIVKVKSNIKEEPGLWMQKKCDTLSHERVKLV